MNLDLQDLAAIIGITSTVTCAYTTVLVVKMKDKIFEKLCSQIERLLVRVGVLENEVSK